jgi:hypothetical protein
MGETGGSQYLNGSPRETQVHTADYPSESEGFEMFLISELPNDVAFDLLNVEDAIVDGNFPASTAYIDVSNYERFGFILMAGALDSALTAQVKQDTSATQTAAIKDVTGATVVIPALGDDMWYAIEVQANRLDINNDFKYVTCAISGAAAGNDYCAILFYGIPGVKPAHQPATHGETVVVAG